MSLRKPHVLVTAAIVVLCVSGNLLAIDVVETYLTMNEGDYYETVNFGESPSRWGTVGMFGGRIDDANGYGTGHLILGGGSTGEVGYLLLRDESRVDFIDGYIDDIDARDNTRVITSGDVDHVFLRDQSFFSMDGGTVGWLWITMGESSVNISCGSVGYMPVGGTGRVSVSGGSVSAMSLEYDSLTTISAGQVGAVWMYDNSELAVTGGELSELDIADSGFVEIEGYGFNYPYGLVPDTVGTLSGFLASGEPLNCAFERELSASIILVPEPASVLLLALGGLALMQRRRG